MKKTMDKMMKTMAILALGLLASCDPPDILDDASFDVWCGDELCSWEVEEGDVEKVATWHSRDLGVGLVGAAVALSQRSEITNQVDCIRFEMLAEVDPGVSLTLEMDFLDDGTVEYSAPLGSDDYQPVTYTVTPPRWFEGVRVRVRKAGEGAAVIAQLRATEAPASECPDDPIPLPREDGASCVSDEECDSGMCEPLTLLYLDNPATFSVCSSCDQDEDCSAEDGETCGIVYPAADASDVGDFAYLACEPGELGALGDHCAGDGECGEGLSCVEAQCAECDPATESTCARSDEGVMQPFQRDPGEGRRASGEGCLHDSDCESGACEGEALSLCSPDGRRCHDSSDCPVIFLTPTCEAVGTDAGVCQ